MLNLNTRLFPLADNEAAGIRLRLLAPLLLVENPLPTLILVVPPKEFNSFPDVVVTQELEPLVPSR